MPKVYVTQIPSRRENGVWIPTVDITPAKKFGELEIIFPAGLNLSVVGQDTLDTLREHLELFSVEDYLLPLGDLTLIALAVKRLSLEMDFNYDGKPFRMLKWDRHMKDYHVIEI